eukprot:1307146-Amphidinium_carterae.1
MNTFNLAKLKPPVAVLAATMLVSDLRLGPKANGILMVLCATASAGAMNSMAYAGTAEGHNHLQLSNSQIGKDFSNIA